MANSLDQNEARQVAVTAGFNNTFIALRHRNFRLWFAGQLVSLIGTWMQNTAQAYLIYELTHSTAFLGYVSFAAGLPSWLFTLYAGVIGDRIPRRTLLVITQTSMMVLAFIIAGLVILNAIQPWQILVLAFLLGIANAFDAPSRMAFVVDLVDREDLTNAIALNGTMFNAATVVGPFVAGFAYALFGAAWCFILNGVSFLAVIVALLMMKLKPAPPLPRKTSTFRELADGFSFFKSNGMVFALIISLGVISMFGNGMVTLLPAWAVQVLNGDSATYGVLLASRGIGALIGALLIAVLSRQNIKGKLWAYGSFVLPVLMIFFAFFHGLSISIASLVGMGLSYMLLVNITNALVQIQIPDNLRGRVMGIYTLTFFGAMPIGSLIIGQAASSVGQPLTVAVSGLMLLGLALIAWTRVPKLRALE
jgi:MFS family permease